MSATTLPPIHAPHIGGDATQAYHEIRALIEHSITNQPRSLQTRIGPSELGTECDHCLAARLAGWPKTDREVAWLPAIGTAVHTMFSDFIISHENNRNAVHTTGIRWLSEQTVTVGRIGNTPITGSVDLFDTHTGTIIDFKVVGATTLRAAKAGPSQVYRTQVHLYAAGYEAGGYEVRNVAIWYVPRNAVTLDSGVFWHEPYDPQVAVDALAHANRVHDQIQALRNINGDVLDQWITSLPRDPDCYDCARYADRPVAAPPATLDDALA